MKQNTNNCEMVQDLIPLYSEGLCSDVSRKIVKEHTASCENCRQLLTQIPADAVPDTPMPDESKPFRKVHKKMKRIRLRNVILSVALAAVVIPVGVLTVGEIIKVPFVPSFTTVMQSIEVRMMMKKLFSGDIDGYMKHITWAESMDLTGMEIDISEFEELRRQDTENLRNAYEAAYGDAKIKRIDVESMHVGSLHTSSAVLTFATAELADGRVVDMQFNKDFDGLYSATVMGRTAGNDAAETAFERTVNFTECHALVPYGFFEYLLKTDGEYLTLNDIRGRMPGILERFQDDYDEQVKKSMTVFYQKDYLVEDCILTLRFDEEKQMLYYETVLVAEDVQGTAIMKTKLYHTYEGLIPPEEDMITIYQHGCTDALASDLANLFG